MPQNVVRYSTRDYNSVVQQFNDEPVLKDQPERMKRGPASVFDTLSNTLNAVANMLFTSTVFSRTHAQILFDLLDYHLAWKTPSSCTERFTISGTGPLTIAKADLVGSTVGTVTQNAVRFEARESLVIGSGASYGDIVCYAQETRPQQNIGKTDGSNFQQVELPDLDVIDDTNQITIDGNSYNRVNTFANSTGTDYHYLLFFRSDGSSYIVLGGENTQDNSEFGFKPPADIDIYADYAVGGGTDTNIENTGEVTEYLGTNVNVSAVTNTTAATGGLDEETLENARNIAPIRLRSAEFFSNESTGLALLKTEVSGFLNGQIVITGLMEVDAYIVPVGGGAPSAGLITEVQDLLEERSYLEQVTATGYSANYINQAISAEVSMLSGYAYADKEKYMELALALRSSEISLGIYEVYYSTGVADAIDRINSDFAALLPYLIGGGDFTNESDAVQIERLLKNIPFQSFGENLNPEDLSTAVQGFVTGVDRCEMLAPTSPVTVPAGSISRPSSIAVAAP